MAGYDSYVKALLHLNVDLTDLSGKTWTAHGGAAVSATDPKFGAKCVYLDGDGDYIDTPDHADWAMGSGDFTVDLWMKRARYGITDMIIGQCDSAGNNSACGLTMYLASVLLDGTTSSLLHFNGANNSTTIVESSLFRTNAWTCGGNAKLSTTSPKFGTASLYCDGTGDYVTCVDNANYQFAMGSGDFTIEGWFKRGRTGTLEQLAGQINAAGQTLSISFQIRFEADDTIRFAVVKSDATTYIYQLTATKISDTTTWHHLAMVRYGNTIKFYIDGTADANTLDVTGVTLNDSGSSLSVGRLGDYTASTFMGYIDEFRISKGIARWTSNFTVPSSEYTFDRLVAGFCVGTGGVGITGITDIQDTNWHHVALVRSGNTMYLFLDGVLEGTVDVTGQTMNDSGYKMAIGAEGEYVVSCFGGYIDEPRISKGIARWTSAFTPPTEEYSGLQAFFMED